MKLVRLAACLAIGVAASGVSGTAAWSPSRDQIQVPRDPSSPGYLNLTKRHPDGAEGAVEFGSSYTSSAALQRLEQMRGFLASFKDLTSQARRTMPAATLSAAGNTSRDMQTIGFHNIPLVVEGTLLKQAYHVAQLEYELVRLKRSRDEATDEDVERARRAYTEATRRFQLFWDTKRPVD